MAPLIVSFGGNYMSFGWSVFICLMVGLAGFVDSIAGGGGLISLPAYLIAGLPAHQAIATNKMSSSMGTTVSTVNYFRSGFINLKVGVFCVVFAFAGSSLGANLALMLDDAVFKWVMLVVLPLTAAYIFSPKSLREDLEALPFAKTTVIASACSFVIGIYDGFYGPGTGTFLILLLTSFAHMKATEANGLAKLINLTTNYAALTVYLLNSQVLLVLGIMAGAFNMIGNYLGSMFFKKHGVVSLKPVMVLVIVIFFIKTIIELF